MTHAINAATRRALSCASIKITSMSFTTEQPRDKTNYDVAAVAVETVQTGNSLVFDFGNGRVLFQVEKVGFSSKRQDDGTYVSAITLTSGTPYDGSDPMVVALPLGTKVIRLLSPSANQA